VATTPSPPISRSSRAGGRKRAAGARAASRRRAKPNKLDRVRAGRRSRPSRTQAERTAQTRARIVEAVHACISELGFARATSAEIARRAGVTWGAAQHHFGGKDGIWLAVLEDSFARFAAKLAEVRDDAPLEERVEAFVGRAWEHFSSPHYRSTFEILIHASDVLPRDSNWRDNMAAAWSRIWSEVFAGEKLPRKRALALQQFTVASLAGLASLRMLESERGSGREAELELLRGALLRELRDA
jgi:AcrR family transcriptional regulator